MNKVPGTNDPNCKTAMRHRHDGLAMSVAGLPAAVMPVVMMIKIAMVAICHGGCDRTKNRCCYNQGEC